MSKITLKDAQAKLDAVGFKVNLLEDFKFIEEMMKTNKRIDRSVVYPIKDGYGFSLAFDDNYDIDNFMLVTHEDFYYFTFDEILEIIRDGNGLERIQQKEDAEFDLLKKHEDLIFKVIDDLVDEGKIM